MVQLPQSVQGYPLGPNGGTLAEYVKQFGWFRIHQGKVRDSYRNLRVPGKRAVVVSPRLSIFDFVLNVLVPDKDEILTAMVHFWANVVFPDVTTHLYCDSPDLMFPQKTTLMVREFEMQEFEFILRMHPGGSVWKKFLQTGILGGQAFPSSLIKWDKLDVPIFTPSTKASKGHDVNIDPSVYYNAMGKEGEKHVQMLIELFERVYKFALSRGIIVLDTKLEISKDGTLADEWFTPDSSRFTTIEDLESALREGRDPIFYDKEPVRTWGRTVVTPFGVTGIQKLEPTNLEHLAFVQGLAVPDEVTAETTSRYHQIFELLVGMPLRSYQQTHMGLN